MTKIASFLIEDKGETAIEYGMIACLVSVLILGAVTTIGGSVADSLNSVVAAFIP